MRAFLLIPDLRLKGIDKLFETLSCLKTSFRTFKLYQENPNKHPNHLNLRKNNEHNLKTIVHIFIAYVKTNQY